jgi:hypothetical protein
MRKIVVFTTEMIVLSLPIIINKKVELTCPCHAVLLK